MEFRQKNYQTLFKFLTIDLKANTTLNINYTPSNYSFLNKTDNKFFFKKNFTKFFFFFFFFVFFFLKKNKFSNNFNYDFSLSYYFFKQKSTVFNFLKSPNRFKMARNQLSFYKNSVKLQFSFFFLPSSKDSFFFRNYIFFFGLKSLPFCELFESNFFFLKNIKINYYNHTQHLLF